MQIKDFVNVTRNKRNNQISFNLKARQLSKIGIKPQDILDINFPKPIKPNIIKKEGKNKIWKK